MLGKNSQDTPCKPAYCWHTGITRYVAEHGINGNTLHRMQQHCYGHIVGWHTSR